MDVPKSIEVFLGLDLHLTATHDEDWFAGSKISVRCRVP